jgi:hypothetical protein
MKIQKIASENLRYVNSRNEMVPTPTYAIIGNSGAAIGKLYKGGQGFETMHTVAYVDWCIELNGDADYHREFPSFTKAKDYIESVQFTVGFRRGGIFDRD